MSEPVNWLDTGIAGVTIAVVEVEAGKAPSRFVRISPAASMTDRHLSQLLSIGFKADPDGAMYRQGGSFRLLEMQPIFPDLTSVTIPRSAAFVPSRELPHYWRVPTAATAAPRSLGLRRAAPQVAATPVSAAPSTDTPDGPPTASAPVSLPVSRDLSRGGKMGLRRPGVQVSEQAPPSDTASSSDQEARIALSAPASAGVAKGGERLNRFQVKYEAGSSLGTAIAAIPVNLAAATAAALERVAENYGNIDAFVADRLQWTLEEMENYLAPEQIDAVALHIAASERGQDFLLADQTGLGKGRVVAAVLRYIALTGRTVIFVTEKENLFSDIFRDINDINSIDLFGRPFILNTDSAIVDVMSPDLEVIYPAWKKQEVDAAIKSGRLPTGCRMLMATYSQFNKVGSPKSHFLKAICESDADMVCDESHNAVGDSATSENMAIAMESLGSVLWSSATFAKDAKNLAAYRRLFPPSMRSSDLMSVLESGGQAIAEAFSQMLAEDGTYLRREHDLSGISLDVMEDTKRLARNKRYSDALHPILAGVARISRNVSEIADERNGGKVNLRDPRSKKPKELWYAGNFGSRLALIVRQFTTALLVDYAVERSVTSLLQGIKPTLVIESTMESLMRVLSSDSAPAPEDAASVEDLPEVAEGDESALVVVDDAADIAPDFKAALRLLVDRTLQLSVRRPGADEPERVQVEDPEIIRAADEIRALIDSFPGDLPMSPIDEIRDRIEAEGRRLFEAGEIQAPWVAEEISARGMRVVSGKYAKMPAIDRNAAVARFNSGRSDALVLTMAASTGLSLHASEKFSDRRQRRMIELEIPSNPMRRVQMFGRVNRRGQIIGPLFDVLSTALPLQTRQMALQNRKMADLSANVTASADSSTVMDVPDMLDGLGNAVCKRLLEERPGLADRMFIPLKLQDMEKAEGELYHVNKFLQRLVLLPAREQEQLYAELLTSYDDLARELAAKGKSPRGARELEGEWRVVEREIFEVGSTGDGPIFGRPVTITTIEGERTLQPWGAQQVAEAVKTSRARLTSQPGIDPAAPFEAYDAAIRRNRATILHSALSKHYMSVKQALTDAKPNAVKDAEARLAQLLRLIATIRPGWVIEMRTEDDHEVGIVLDVRAPASVEEAHHAGRWSIRYIMPGDEAPREISAAAVMRDPSCELSPADRISSTMVRAFDIAPSGVRPVQRKVLDGNLVLAVIAARHAGWGSSVTWTDEMGVPRRAIMVPKNRQNSISVLPGRLVDPGLACRLLEEGAELYTNPDDPEGGARLQLEGDHVHMVISGGKKVAKLFETDAVATVTGPLAGDQRNKWADVPAAKAETLLRALSGSGHAFHFEGRFRSRVAELAEELAEMPRQGLSIRR